MNSSNASLHCRLEWRPSRWLLVGMAVLALLAIASLWLSALPAPACIAGSAAIVVYALYRMRHEMRREPAVIAWAGGDAPVMVETGMPEADVVQPGVVQREVAEQGARSNEFRFAALNFRAGLVVMSLTDQRGRRSRWVWWPDTLDARGRRALRLAASTRRDPLLAQSQLPAIDPE